MRFRFYCTILMVIFCLQSCRSIYTPHAIKNDSIQNYAMPKKVILVIADGMGFSYLQSLKIYSGLKENNFDKFTCKTNMSTCSKEGESPLTKCVKGTSNVTDSAASATALATGVKVPNDVVSLDLTNNKPIETILEIAKKLGKSTGVVATKLISDATPAAFASHAKNRKDTNDILKSMFEDVMPTLIFGSDNDEHKEYAKKSVAHYAMVSSNTELKNTLASKKFTDSCKGANCPYIYGGFSTHSLVPDSINIDIGLPLEITPNEYFVKKDIPHLSEMTNAALSILNKNENGFFLMVESSMTDIIGHHNRIIDENKKTPSALAVLVREMIELEHTIGEILKFAQNNPDTLVVFTADHETGGLVLDEQKTPCLGQESCLAHASWTSAIYQSRPNKIAHHTNANVPLFAIGQGSELFCQENMDNADIPKNILIANGRN